MIVPVIGMHRTGTTMMAGILQQLGINMGNSGGYREDSQFRGFNDKILKNAGGNWCNVPPKEKIIENMETKAKKIGEFFQKRNNNGSNCGWKDPRTVVTFPLYWPILQKQADVRYIFTNRPRNAIIASLNKRQKKDYEECYERYRQELNQILDLVQNCPILCMEYDYIIDYPEMAVVDIAKFLGIEDEGKKKKAIGYVDPTKRHW